MASACGSDSGDTAPLLPAPDDPTALTVIATDVAFDAETYRVDAGEVDVTFLQEGLMPHSLAIETAEGRQLGEALLVNVAETEATATIELEPGTYVLWCTIPGHRALGQEATLIAS
ncbi:MAG: plastocyanin/azurin family copper-binding protein [Actinomycetota bacterium]